MKKMCSLTFFAALLSFSALAQSNSPDWSKTYLSKNIAEQVNQSVAVCDTVSDFRVVSAALTLINIGGRYPKQNLTVAIKGDKIKVNAALMKGKAVCFFGPVTLFKNKPEIVITEPEQIKDIKIYQ